MMQPAPRQPVSEVVLDDVIQKIESDLPRIHKMCKKQKKQKKRPSDKLPRRAQTKARFQELSEDPLLNEEGTDIRELPEAAAG